MPQIPDLINLAIPGFIALLLLEVVLDAVMHRDLYQFKDTAASLAMGTGSVILGVVSKALAFAAYSAVHRFAIFNIGYQWWAWAILFFAEDLTYYWFHRTSHECRLFWASHVVHH
jgi:sterol desaturase/sphingolipid hydroxylase (fatty acid hydroxylase superfamily)